MCYFVIYNRRSLASHVLTANKPVDWRLFFSFVLVAAAAASWILCCSWYLFHGLDHVNAAKKGSSNTERGKLDWMGNKPWITCICRLASCTRSWTLTIIKIKLKLHWFAVGQIFTKRWKDNANTYDTQQFIYLSQFVNLLAINTWYSDIFKIQKVKPFNQQTTVL